jgi:transposase
VIDEFSLGNKEFLDFIEKKTGKIKVISGRILHNEKIDRLTLGLILIQKMRREHMIFRVEEKIANNKVSYEFFPEKFIDKDLLEDLVKRLKISGVCSKSYIEMYNFMEKLS